MKILVAGNNLMSLRIVDALMHRHQVVCLQPAGTSNWKTDQLNADMVVGEITSPQALTDAGAETCDAFIACSTVDEQNIVACMAARRLGAQRTICVVNGHSFLTTGDDGAKMTESLGIQHVVRPIEQLSDELISIVLVPGALEIESVADGRLALFRYAVEANSKSVGKKLSDLNLPDKTRLVHVRRGEEFIVPRGDTVLQPGDKVISMGTRESCAQLGPLLCAARPRAKEAAIIGGGRVGRAVTRGLMSAGWRVTVIDSNEDRCKVIAERTEALVLHGDGTDLSLLEQEHIGERPVVIAVTDSDEKNLLVSLVVKQLGDARVVTRADRLSNERLFERVGIDVVRSARGAAIRTILRAIDERESEILTELEHGTACVMEITVRPGAKELGLTQLAPPAYAVVGGILRGNETLIPGGQDSLQPEDHLFVFCARDDREAVTRYFEQPTPPADND